MIKDKIIRTLSEAASGLKLLDDGFFVIGASAIILSGTDIGNTGDIDIIVSSHDADKLKKIWKDKIESNPQLKDSDLFKSNFGRYKFLEMDIEIIGDLLIFRDGRWTEVKVQEYTLTDINGLSVKIPTIKDQERILQLFGREKDMVRLELIKDAGLL